jgi:hypothetical protein
MTTAKEAKECAETIMKGDGKPAWARKMVDYFGEWNTLMLYLDAQVLKEAQPGSV